MENKPQTLRKMTASTLITEVTLELLGNCFYGIDGEISDNLQDLLDDTIQESEDKSKNLQSVLQIPSEYTTPVIVIEDEEEITIKKEKDADVPTMEPVPEPVVMHNNQVPIQEKTENVSLKKEKPKETTNEKTQLTKDELYKSQNWEDRYKFLVMQTVLQKDRMDKMKKEALNAFVERNIEFYRNSRDKTRWAFIRKYAQQMEEERNALFDFINFLKAQAVDNKQSLHIPARDILSADQVLFHNEAD